MLRPLSEQFPSEEHPQILVGLAAPDDAAVCQIDASRAIISTADFFPPVVDDPYDFGAIAAANALSDVYAMGGRPLMAINLVAWPDDLDKAILAEIMRGGADKVREAGAVIAGGHSISDAEPKYGLSVTGEVNPRQNYSEIRRAPRRPADIEQSAWAPALITTALKRGIAEPAQVDSGRAIYVTPEPDNSGAWRKAHRCISHDRHHRIRLDRPWTGNGAAQRASTLNSHFDLMSGFLPGAEALCPAGAYSRAEWNVTWSTSRSGLMKCLRSAEFRSRAALRSADFGRAFDGGCQRCAPATCWLPCNQKAKPPYMLGRGRRRDRADSS